MTPQAIETLTDILTERLTAQLENDSDGDPTQLYTPQEMLQFAIEEAWLNNELDFLTTLTDHELDALRLSRQLRQLTA